jgi:hypothetical protein
LNLRTANDRALKRLEQLQGTAGTPKTFVFKGTEYPCAETRGQFGAMAGPGGIDEQITKSLIVRTAALAGAAAPASGHIVALPHLDNEEFRVVAATLAPDGSHWTLELGAPENL